MPTDRSWTAVLAALTAVALVAMSGPALAHGSQTTMVQETEHYEVTYHTFKGISQGEWIRIGWGIVNTSTGEREDLSDATVTYTCYGGGGAVVHQADKGPLNLTDNTFMWTDVFVHDDCTRQEHVYPLPTGEQVSFSEEVVATEPDNGGGNGNDEEEAPPSTPLPGWAALIALAGAAVGLALLSARRRRGG